MIELQTAERPARLAVVVLTWNDTKMTSKCLASVLANDCAETVRVIVVDNGSKEPVAPTLEPRFPGVEVSRIAENAGFAMGCNHGLDLAREGGAEHILLLNNDTVLYPTVIRELAAALDADPEAGMVSGLILYPGEPRIVQYYRGDVIRESARHFAQDDGAVYRDEFSATVESDFAPACGVMFRSRTLEQIGQFDPAIYICWEDYDICLRLRDHDWKILTVGAAPIVHEHGQTTGRASPYITYYFQRNRLICLFRHAGLGGILRNSPHTLRSYWWTLKSLKSWPAYRAMARGMFHAAIGVRGVGKPPLSRKG